MEPIVRSAARVVHVAGLMVRLHAENNSKATVAVNYDKINVYRRFLGNGGNQCSG